MKNVVEPKLSVILPIYNAEKFAFQAIKSILNQSYADFEFIIINDGSTDETQRIINSINDPRIRIIENQKNIGLIGTLNKGLNLAKAKYVARMDADDISTPERFQKQVDFLENHPDIVAVGSAYQPIDNQQKPVTKAIHRPTSPITAEWFMVIGCPIAHPSVMYRTEIAHKIGGYDNNYPHTEDYDFWARMIEFGGICSLPEVLLYYRVGEKNRISEKYSTIQFQTTQKIRQKYFLQHFNHEMSDAVSEIIQTGGQIGCDRQRKIACDQLLFAYHTVLANKNSTANDRTELNEIVYSHILEIRNQISDPRYYFSISRSNLEIVANQIVKSWIIITTRKFVLKLKSYIKRVFC